MNAFLQVTKKSSLSDTKMLPFPGSQHPKVQESHSTANPLR